MKNDIMTGIIRALRDWRLDDEVQVESSDLEKLKPSRQISDMVFSCLDGVRYRVAGDVYSVWRGKEKLLRVRMAGVATPSGKQDPTSLRPRITTRDMVVELRKTTYYIRVRGNARWAVVSRHRWLEWLESLASA